MNPHARASRKSLARISCATCLFTPPRCPHKPSPTTSVHSSTLSSSSTRSNSSPPQTPSFTIQVNCHQPCGSRQHHPPPRSTSTLRRARNHSADAWQPNVSAATSRHTSDFSPLVCSCDSSIATSLDCVVTRRDALRSTSHWEVRRPGPATCSRCCYCESTQKYGRT